MKFETLLNEIRATGKWIDVTYPDSKTICVKDLVTEIVIEGTFAEVKKQLQDILTSHQLANFKFPIASVEEPKKLSLQEIFKDFQIETPMN